MKAMAQERENERVGTLGRREKNKNIARETAVHYILIDTRVSMTLYVARPCICARVYACTHHEYLKH